VRDQVPLAPISTRLERSPGREVLLEEGLGDGHLLRGLLAETIGALVAHDPRAAPEVRDLLITSIAAGDELRALGQLGPRGEGYRLAIRLALFESEGDSVRCSARLNGRGVIERALAAELVDSREKRALPDLEALLDNEEHPRGAEMREVGGTSVGIYMEADAANAVVWDAASRAIARIDPDHPQAIRGLALMVESADDPRDRVRAAAALGRHGAAAVEQVDALLGATRSEDDRLVAEAITALGMIGVTSDDVLARLRSLARDERPEIAKRAEAARRVFENR
jgi:hypothetical protein